VRAGLQLTHGHDPNSSPFRKFLLAPIEESAGGSTLRWRHHFRPIAQKYEFINSVEKRLTEPTYLL
jgi:hypothetical protein